jgi:uncharacterized protein with HEPN domain
MSENIKDREFSDYLNDILEAIDDIQSFIKDMSFTDLESDKKTLYAVIRCLEILGEAVRKIPKNVKERYPDIPWKEIAGIRDKLIHEYFGVDTQTIWDTIQEDLSPLKETITNIINGSR